MCCAVEAGTVQVLKFLLNRNFLLLRERFLFDRNYFCRQGV